MHAQAVQSSAPHWPRICPHPPNRLYLAGCPVRVDHHIPGALSILKGAVPDRTRGFGHTAPTYVSRFPGSNIPRPGRHRILEWCLADPRIEAEKAALRLKARATRAAIAS